MTEEDNHKGERIAKYLSRAGICSRREAERWIEQRRIRVNGQTLDSPAFLVTDSDTVEADGKPVASKEKTRLFIYNKPAGLVTSHKDEQGRRTVFDEMPKGLPRVISVGRLDLSTEGLLLLTNDGELSRYLELPSTGWSRKYRVRVLGRVTEEKLARLKNGITVEGVRYKSILATIENNTSDSANTWLIVTLKEGKNREIRRVMEAIGLKVNRLIRVSYGPFNLGSLPKGAAQEIKGTVLKQQIKGFFKGNEDSR